MKILLLGATGRTGQVVAREALKRGHRLAAVVRSKAKLGMPEVEAWEGAPTDLGLLDKALENAHGAICCLNIARQSDFPWARLISPETLISDAVRALIQAMEAKRITRIVTMSAWGVGDTWMQMNWFFRLLVQNSNIRFALEDHNRQEELLRKSKMDWTIVRPVFLNNKYAAAYKVASYKPLKIGISRQAVAAFMLDSLEQKTFVRKAPVIFKG